jgi:putative transposase
MRGLWEDEDFMLGGVPADYIADHSGITLHGHMSLLVNISPLRRPTGASLRSCSYVTEPIAGFTLGEDVFRNRYRIPSNRKKNHDYRKQGWYFVTICTYDKSAIFGHIESGRMQLSAAGCIASEEWIRTSHIRPFVQLDAWVVMPDHIHGVIGLFPPPKQEAQSVFETPHRGVSTGHLQTNSLGAIIGQYKSICCKRIRAQVDPEFAWQTRFHDRIVRSERERLRIRAYIVNNPQKWSSTP